ncbi:sensor histidine kinase [Acanthopleuribacter pedis]|uniref:histidine kinase n=1 Tax=Acanthopleuribacter pedis TaxID=442870 RepID=A0A8J7Q298_9BACT|nr:HAMP domain-containing sensor histidine kinase [Acanthopleuribacter pedis]MBO1319192.1 hypothetical protein [Acanthopleuribacter pedis]
MKAHQQQWIIKFLMFAPPILFILYAGHSLTLIRGLLSKSSSFHLDYANNLIQDYLEMSLAIDLNKLEACISEGRLKCPPGKWTTLEGGGDPLTFVQYGNKQYPVYLREEVLPEVLENYFNTKPGLKGLLTSRYHEPVYWIQILDENKEVVYRSGPQPDPEAAHQVYAMSRTLKKYSIDIVYRSFGPKQLYSVARTRINFAAGFLLFIMAVFSLMLITRAIRQKILLARQKTFFVTTISHEFKTPLAIIRLAAETLAAGRTKTKEDEKKFHNMISAEINRLDHLVHKVLSFNKIELGQISYNAQPIDLRDIVTTTCDAFQMQAESEGFTFEVAITNEPCPILGDPGLIRHAIDNICDNAFKYSGDNKYVAVTLERRGDQIRLAIRDRGIGIPANELPHITKSFYRVEDQKAGGIRGSGLGLSISSHILNHAKARLDVDSTHGEGTTFTLMFPVNQ